MPSHSSFLGDMHLLSDKDPAQSLQAALLPPYDRLDYYLSDS